MRILLDGWHTINTKARENILNPEQNWQLKPEIDLN